MHIDRRIKSGHKDPVFMWLRKTKWRGRRTKNSKTVTCFLNKTENQPEATLDALEEVSETESYLIINLSLIFGHFRIVTNETATKQRLRNYIKRIQYFGLGVLQGHEETKSKQKLKAKKCLVYKLIQQLTFVSFYLDFPTFLIFFLSIIHASGILYLISFPCR